MSIQGCSKTYKTQIRFDGFGCEIKANAIFEEMEDKEKLSENLSIQKLYIAQEQSGFVDSIIINKEYNNNTIALEKLAEITIQKSAKRLQGFKADDPKILEIKCNEDSFGVYKQSFVFDSITPDEKIYSSQIFFIYNNYLYSISTATEDKRNNKNIQSSLKKITCEKK
ncbi:hypothetical protein KKG31_07635 [Patescibacteria group bacterium]|nr:hypothetical protein [Patescibacteria group bacterium]MBU1758939.1 hypothetical protein [Patescibacteria group bacterium]